VLPFSFVTFLLGKQKKSKEGTHNKRKQMCSISNFAQKVARTAPVIVSVLDEYSKKIESDNRAYSFYLFNKIS